MVFLMMFGLSVVGQTASLPSMTASPNEHVTFPITVTNFISIGSIEFHIQIDPAILVFEGASGGVLGNAVNSSVFGSEVIILWNDVNYLTIVNDILTNLVFKYNGPGTCQLAFLPAKCEVIHMPGFVPVNVTYNVPAIAQISPVLTNPTKATLLNQTCALNGSTVSLPVQYTGFVSNVGSIIQKILYDETKMTFVNVTGFGSFSTAPVNASANSGIVTITWDKPSGGNINFAEGNYFKLNFTFIGSVGTTIGFYPGCIIATNTAVNIPVSYFDGIVTVNPIITPNITPGGPTTFCEGSSVILTSSAAKSYLWSTGATTRSITVTTSGDYTVTVSDGSCFQTSAPVSVTVNSKPEARITAWGPLTFCDGGDVVLLASDGSSWLWSNGASTQSITVSVGGIYTVTVSNDNCSATSTPLTVTVNELPTVTIDGLAGVCFGSQEVVYSTQPGMTGYIWAVSEGGTINSGTGSNSILVEWNTSGAQWVSVNYTNETGCSALMPTLFPIIVFPDFLPGLISPDQTIRYNTIPLPLSGVEPTGGNSPYAFQWQNSTDGLLFTDIPGASDLNYAPGNLTVTTFYRQLQTSADNCGTLSTNILTITVDPPPFITIASPNGGEDWQQGFTYPIIWDDNITENVKIDLYKGITFHTQIIDSTPSSGTFSWIIPSDQTTGTDYRVKITSISDDTVYDLSEGDFTISYTIPTNLFIQDDTVYNLQSNCYNAIQTITVAGSGTSFDVQNGGNATLIAGQNIHFLPTTTVQSGGYMWGYIAPNGPYCLTSSIPAVITGQQEVPLWSQQSFFKIYPNPTTGSFILDFKRDFTADEVIVDLFGIWGEKVLSKVLTGERKHEFSLSDRPTGVYFIRVVSGDKAETVKIIKH